MLRDSRFIGRVELLIEHIKTMMLDKKRGNKAKLGIMQADGMPIIAHQQGCLSVLIFVYLKVFSCCKTHWGLQVLKLLHPGRSGRLTWNIILEVWKMIFLSKWVIYRFQPLIFPGVYSYATFA